MKEIPLSRGAVAQVSDSDYEHLSKVKWSLSVNGGRRYAIHEFDGKMISMHRYILGESCVGLDVDHIDGNGLNNQRSNLRACTRAQNLRNRGRVNKRKKYKGVFPTKNGRFYSTIHVEYKMIWLGTFDTEEQAATAYNNAALHFFGEFARLNKIERNSA